MKFVLCLGVGMTLAALIAAAFDMKDPLPVSFLFFGWGAGSGGAGAIWTLMGRPRQGRKLMAQWEEVQPHDHQD